MRTADRGDAHRKLCSTSQEVLGMLPHGTQIMSIDIATVRYVARLASLALTEDEAEKMCGELNEILTFIEQLSEVDAQGVPPMNSVVPATIKMRQDVVTEGNNAEEIVANAPLIESNFFLVPKILE